MKLPERFKIKYVFAEFSFNYELPLLGVDLEFIKERRIELNDCLQKLAKKIGQINIASKKGAADFDTANKLVKYYHFAKVTLDIKESVLLGHSSSNSEAFYSEEHAKSINSRFD